MGMPISLALRGRHADGPLGQEAWRAVVDELREVDATFSTYRENSVISRLRRDEITPAECPADVREVLALGREAERQSGGAFSIALPASDGSRRIDPTGIVKGWAVERASRLLSALDDTDFCLSAGGDMTCHVADPHRAPWRIGIENPHDTTSLIATVPLRSGAIATSGSAHRGAHIVDPRDGRTPSEVASATIVAASLTWADIDATTAVVQGRESLHWLEDRPIRGGLLVWADGSTSALAGVEFAGVGS
jgi:thiamine biosynthesis lipoprotein